jgi:phage I-like protein
MNTHVAELLSPFALGNEPPTEFLIFPAGSFRARWDDGSEHEGLFDAKAAEAVIRSFGERGHDLPVDYNHNTMKAKGPVDDRLVRAAGSFELEVRDGALYAVNVKWTADAEAYIRGREYRYISPVWSSADDGRPVEVFNVALTPNPAMLGYRPLVATAHVPASAGRKDTSMDLKKFAASLGMPEGTQEADVISAAGRLRTFQSTVLSIVGATDPDAAVGSVQAALAKAGQVDQLQAKLDAQAAEAERQEREVLVAAALKDRKLSPAQAAEGGFARTAPLATLKAFLKDAPRIIPDEVREPGPSGVQKKWAELSPIEKHNLHGRNPELYQALKAEHEQTVKRN